MKSHPKEHTELLVKRLRHALAGTKDRVISVDSLRSLVALEVAEWKHEATSQVSLNYEPGALIAGPSALFC
jgi:hypothetical protein